MSATSTNALKTDFPVTCKFFSGPSKVKFDEGSYKNVNSINFKRLHQSLSLYGPHVALGKIGPDSFTDTAEKLDRKINGHEIYGWGQGANRVTKPSNSYLMLVGVHKSEQGKSVLYTLTDDVTRDNQSTIREHQTSQDSKVYQISHKTFNEGLYELYAPIN